MNYTYNFDSLILKIRLGLKKYLSLCLLLSCLAACYFFEIKNGAISYAQIKNEIYEVFGGGGTQLLRGKIGQQCSLHVLEILSFTSFFFTLFFDFVVALAVGKIQFYFYIKSERVPVAKRILFAIKSRSLCANTLFNYRSSIHFFS